MTSMADYFSFQRGILDDGRLFIAAMPMTEDDCLHLFLEGKDGTVTRFNNTNSLCLTVSAPFELSPEYFAPYGYDMLSGRSVNQLSNAIICGAHQNCVWRALDVTDAILALDANGIRALCDDFDLALGIGMPLPDGIEKDPVSGKYTAIHGADVTPDAYLSFLRDEIHAFFGKRAESLSDRDVEIAGQMLTTVRARPANPEEGPDLASAPKVALLIACDMSDDNFYRRVVAVYADEKSAMAHMEKAERFISGLAPLYNRDIPAILNPLDPGFSGGCTIYLVETVPFVGRDAGI